MFNHVTIAIDRYGHGHPLAQVVHALAPQSARTLVTVYPEADVPGPPELRDYAALLHEEATAMLERERIAAGLPDASVVAVADASAARGLKRAAAEQHADLLVVGPSERSPLGSMVLGEVSRGVFHGAPCPVLVVPRGDRVSADGPCQIGVAFDGSPEATHALQLAGEIARESGAHVEVVEAIDLGLRRPFAGPDLDDYAGGLVDREQQRLQEAVSAIGVTCRAEAVRGSVREVLGGLARRVDLVVCGSRGWGPAARTAFGSTADDLIHAARCPVLVVPRGAHVAPISAPPQLDADQDLAESRR